MDEIRNPFAPGAGTQPPELAGRDHIIKEADISIRRLIKGKHEKSQIFLGLRGVGKTVLLNRIERIAEEHQHLTAFVEAPENSSLGQMLYPKIQQALRRLSNIEQAKTAVHSSMKALKNFASVFKLEIGDYSLSVNPENGIADSGKLEFDLTDVLLSLGKATQTAQSAWTLFIDEVQYLSTEELAALTVAVHRVNQKQLPIMVFAAGLPQIAALSGEAKSYAERLFTYRQIGPLENLAARAAIYEPIKEEREDIDEDALQQIVAETEGYPYFLQEWGFQSWNQASESPIGKNDVSIASKAALARLDEGFFQVRFDRLTPAEKDCVIAMARLGGGPYSTGAVAKAMDKSPTSFAPLRASIIRKGMIYSPQHGELDFTVPMFGAYLNRASRV